jgi:hypothetical protein
MPKFSCTMVSEDPGTITGLGHIAGVSPCPRSLREVSDGTRLDVDVGEHEAGR